MRDLDRSLDRLLNSEATRARFTGFGTAKQGQALVRLYIEQLTASICADRGRDRDVWRALRGITDGDIALRLLVAGISVSEGGDLGVDEDGEKNLRDMALWIGRNLGKRGEIGLKIGVWGMNMLVGLPVFGLDGDILKMTVAADEIMDDVLVRALKSNSLLSPLTEPPSDWTQVGTGGLPAGHWATVPLIRERHPSIENAVRHAIGRGKMRRVLDAINTLQRVPFTINEPLLDFMLRSEALAAKHPLDMVTAEELADHDRFYVPLNMDFRGRIYGIPHFNFAREDLIRALFLFADGKPIGEEGLWWLKVHVAGTANGNSWSNEEKPGRLSRQERVKWVDANLDTLRNIGKAVLRCDDLASLGWALPKDPYQFLAACVELEQALDAGPDFITRLPLTFDATGSGLQHLCLMTRAEEGRYVNLGPNEEADDFYRRVAYLAWSANPELNELMEDNPFNREIVKQPAMSYFYGSRPGGWQKLKNGRWRAYGMTKQINGVLKDRNQPAKKFAHTIYRVIEDMAPGAKSARDLLERLAELCAENGRPLRWTTALGLPVINIYHKPDIKRVRVRLNGRVRRINFTVGDKDGIWKSKAKDAAPANFVHSVDAAHLQLIALAAAGEGIEMVSVHDCFGCIAPNAGRLNAIILEQLKHLHEDSLVAGVWASACDDISGHTLMPILPATGNLDIEKVLQSEHAYK
jgi:Autographiviridae RNA polymerase